MAEVVSVYNNSVAGLWARVQRFAVEIQKSNSANVSRVSIHDVERIETFIKALRFRVAEIAKEEPLDLVETNPTSFDLRPEHIRYAVENESINDILGKFYILGRELIKSQSARIGNGLLTFDFKRLNSMIDDIESFMVNYVANATPLDLPKSSPMQSNTGKGSDGLDGGIKS